MRMSANIANSRNCICTHSHIIVLELKSNWINQSHRVLLSDNGGEPAAHDFDWLLDSDFSVLSQRRHKLFDCLFGQVRLAPLTAPQDQLNFYFVAVLEEVQRLLEPNIHIVSADSYR